MREVVLGVDPDPTKSITTHFAASSRQLDKGSSIGMVTRGSIMPRRRHVHAWSLTHGHRALASQFSRVLSGIPLCFQVTMSPDNATSVSTVLPEDHGAISTVRE